MKCTRKAYIKADYSNRIIIIMKREEKKKAKESKQPDAQPELNSSEFNIYDDSSKYSELY